MAFSPTHAMVAVAMGSAIAPRRWLGPGLIAGAACAVMPDVDLLLPLVASGGREWHRTVTHSVFFAAAVGLAVSALASRRSEQPAGIRVPLYLALSTASHGMLDSMTTYPVGVAFYSPLSWERYIAPWQPISGAAVELGLFVGLVVVSLAFLRIRSIRRFTSESPHSTMLLDDDDGKPPRQVKG